MSIVARGLARGPARTPIVSAGYGLGGAIGAPPVEFPGVGRRPPPIRRRKRREDRDDDVLLFLLR